MSVQESSKPIPAPPEGITDPDQIAGGEERWTECPLKDCKRNPELLYEDFYLRGMRSNRLMCSKCAVRVEMGYMAREEVKKADDKFFKGTQSDNLITFGVMFAGSLAVNTIMFLVGFWYLALLLGAGAGAGIATFARRLAKGRVTRQMPYFAIGGIVVGALLAPSAFFFLRTGFFIFNPAMAFNITGIITTVAMGSGAWGVFMRKI